RRTATDPLRRGPSHQSWVASDGLMNPKASPTSDTRTVTPLTRRDCAPCVSVIDLSPLSPPGACAVTLLDPSDREQLSRNRNAWRKGYLLRGRCSAVGGARHGRNPLSRP